MRDLSRLLNPSSIAIVGGGAWCRDVVKQAAKFNPDITLYPVHPSLPEIEGLRAYPSVKHLPEPPDATFVGINREATVGVVERLRKLKAGGAVCFASGFSEMQKEDSSGQDAQARLLKAAGDMPVLGPNCYGFINALDRKVIWPDQHGCQPVDRGVAILTQSSNIAINLTMQQRGLPIAYMIACGNQAQLSHAEIATALLDDPRVTAIGLHIEGFQDISAWQELSETAMQLGIPLVGLKVGKSDQAKAATISHTASLAGADAGAQALLERCGIARVDDLPTFLETLKLAHHVGRLDSNKIASISCSGGEASLIADQALRFDLEFPALSGKQHKALRDVLGPRVALSNPLDYHTFIWRDAGAMGKCWAAMSGADTSLTLSIVDFPRGDICDPTDWDCAVEAAANARKLTDKPFAVVATLPELLPEAVSAKLSAQGVIPMHGLNETLGAIEALSRPVIPDQEPLLAANLFSSLETLTEREAKAELAQFGVSVPRNVEIANTGDAANLLGELAFPVAVKAIGLAHKTEAGGVVLNCETPEGIVKATGQMPHDGPFLIEEMANNGVELLVGIVNDPPHGLLLTIGAGGVLTELLEDSVSMLLPVDRNAVKQCLLHLKVTKLLSGYRGSDAADLDAIIDTVLAIQDYVVDHRDEIAEVEINPLICTPTGAIAVDALIRKGTI